MIDRLATWMAEWIKREAPEHPSSVDVIKFPIAAMLNAGGIILLTLLVSIVTGRTGEAVIVLVGYAFLRQVSGGVHIKSGDVCVLVSVAGATILSYADLGQEFIYALTAMSILLALIFAPSKIEGQTRIPHKFFPVLKVLTIVMIASNLFWQSAVLAAAFFIQALTLVHWKGVKKL